MSKKESNQISNKKQLLIDLRIGNEINEVKNTSKKIGKWIKNGDRRLYQNKEEKKEKESKNRLSLKKRESIWEEGHKKKIKMEERCKKIKANVRNE